MKYHCRLENKTGQRLWFRLYANNNTTFSGHESEIGDENFIETDFQPQSVSGQVYAKGSSDSWNPQFKVEIDWKGYNKVNITLNPGFAPVYADYVNEYQVTIENRCPNQVWFRLYDDVDAFYLGDVVKQNNQIVVKTKFQPFNVQGLCWEDNEPEVWKPTFKNYIETYQYQKVSIVITPVFGPRVASSIKLFVASLAGPADTTSRNDIQLIQKFREEGVPVENIWSLFEKQCTPQTIQTCLSHASDLCNDGDAFVVYLGGHGSGGQCYTLCTHGQGTTSDLVINSIKNCPAHIYMIIDSCYSGQMIEDATAYFEKNKQTNISFLSSTQADNTASTGWRLVQFLIDKVFQKSFVHFQNLATEITNQLKTGNVKQKAQFKMI